MEVARHPIGQATQPKRDKLIMVQRPRTKRQRSQLRSPATVKGLSRILQAAQGSSTAVRQPARPGPRLTSAPSMFARSWAALTRALYLDLVFRQQRLT